jgi:hypothetical protein
MPLAGDSLNIWVIIHVRNMGFLNFVIFTISIISSVSGEGSNSLQFVELTRFSQSECIKEYESNPGKSLQIPKGIIPSQFCTGERAGEKDTCDVGDDDDSIVV